MSEINEEQVGDEELELASRAEQQFASSFLLERMNLEPSEVKRLQAPPAPLALRFGDSLEPGPP